MNRAARRRESREKEKSTKTYNYSMDQLKKEVQMAVDDNVEAIRQQAKEEAYRDMLFYIQAIPSYVLAKDHWTKSANKRLPAFIDRVTEVYNLLREGKMTEQVLREYVENLIN